MLRIGRHPTKATADSHSAVFLKTAVTIRIDHFQRTFTLPLSTVVFGVGKNPGLLIEQVVHLHHERITRKRSQPVENLVLIPFVVYYALIHAEVHKIETPIERKTSRRQAVRRLPHNVFRKQISTSDDLRRFETGLETRDAQHGRLSNFQ